MKLYTGVGDRGETSLFSGDKVKKSHVRVNAYGELDEANSVLGWALSSADVPSAIRAFGRGLQSDLFDLGAELATPAGNEEKLQRHLETRIDDDGVMRLEAEIDRASSKAPALTTFVLPGGVEGASRMHVARTVFRRAERAIVALDDEAPLRSATLIFVNRVSDLLFAWARELNALADQADVPWAALKDRD